MAAPAPMPRPFGARPGLPPIRPSVPPAPRLAQPARPPMAAPEQQASASRRGDDLEAVPRVVMSWNEFDFAVGVGVRRQLENLRDGRTDRYGCPESVGWQVHIEGTGGEAAVAKHLGIYWNGALGDLKADDVGRYQVRTCNPAGKQRLSLILHDSDPDDRVFVMALGPYVEGGLPVFRLPGWIRAADGKQGRWWWEPRGNGRPAYFVPWQDLRPMSELPLVR